MGKAERVILTDSEGARLSTFPLGEVSATAWDIPAVKSTIPISVRITDVSVTSSVFTDKFKLGNEGVDMAGTDSNDDAAPAWYIVVSTDAIVPECSVDGDKDNDDDKALGDTEVGGFKYKVDN